MRRQWGRIGLLAVAMGLIASPPAQVGNQVNTARGTQSEPGKQQIPQTQAPQAVVIERFAAQGGSYSRHPVWLGRGKRGAGRKAGNRSKWDYRR